MPAPTRAAAAAFRIRAGPRAFLSGMTTVLAMRHADVDVPPADAHPLLNAAGRRRAEALARMVGGAGVSAILTSTEARTQQTAAPTADLLGLATRLTPDPQVLAKRVRAGDLGDVVLLVGHSDTVPAVIDALGGPPVVIGEREFGTLFVVTAPASGPTTLLRLTCG
jgi:phosphohistidine phosphatase SixA